MPAPNRSTYFSPNVLSIVPPYMMGSPPAGTAALLGYLKANGCPEFDFLDLRLWAPAFPFTPMDHAPTFRYTGAFSENYVVDVPDLPLVLDLFRAFSERRCPLIGEPDHLFRRYCRERLRDPEWLHSYLARTERFLRAVFAQLPELEFVGFSVWPSNYLTTLLASAILKERPSPPFITAGGPHVTESSSAAMLGLKSGLFDAVVLGEGEATLVELFDRFRNGGGQGEPIPGTMMMETSGEFSSPLRPLLDMSELPLPDYGRMNIDAYSTGNRTISFEMSRGCINSCTFCSEWAFWKRYRTIRPEQAFERLQTLKSLYGFNRVMFTDSLVNGNKEHLRRFAELVAGSDITFEWSAYMRADVDDNTADILYRSGLRHAFIGVESIDDRTLEIMKKSRTGEDNIKAVRALLDQGVAVELGIIPGFPGDTRERFVKTIEVVRDLVRRYPMQVSMSLAPYTLTPGQRIYQNPDSFGLAVHPWDDEYLAIAPDHHSITKLIPCCVTGNNQGVERTGQMTLLEHVSRNRRRSLTRIQQSHLFSSGPVSVWQVGLSSSQFRIVSIANGWYLGVRTTDTGGLYGALLSGPEIEEFQRLRQGAAAQFPVALGSDELPPQIFKEFFDRIEQQHLIKPHESPLVSTFCSLDRADEDWWVTVSPHAVARPVTLEDGEVVLVANITSYAAKQLTAGVIPILEHIYSAGATVGEIDTFVEKSSQLPSEQWKSILRELNRIGILNTAACPVTLVPPLDLI